MNSSIKAFDTFLFESLQKMQQAVKQSACTHPVWTRTGDHETCDICGLEVKF